MNHFFVYGILNLVGELIYIGKTNNLYSRIHAHKLGMPEYSDYIIFDILDNDFDARIFESFCIILFSETGIQLKNKDFIRRKTCDLSPETTKRIKAYIKANGVQKQFIAKILGISKKVFSNRLAKDNWTESEMVFISKRFGK